MPVVVLACCPAVSVLTGVTVLQTFVDAAILAYECGMNEDSLRHELHVYKESLEQAVAPPGMVSVARNYQCGHVSVSTGIIVYVCGRCPGIIALLYVRVGLDGTTVDTSMCGVALPIVVHVIWYETKHAVLAIAGIE